MSVLEPGLVSVIIPLYNAEKFVHQAYTSIINQKLESFEIIFIDNNSVDSSSSIVEKISERDSRVRFYQETKQGAAAARNKGIREAKGEYLYFFDVDDQLFENSINTLLHILEQNQDADSAFGKSFRSYKGLSETEKPTTETLNVVKKEKGYWGLIWLSQVSKLYGPPAFLHRKKSLLEKVGFFNEELLLGEDAALHIQLGLEANILYVDKYIYLYFRHKHSTVSQRNKIEEKVFTYWPRLVKAHLPYMLQNEVTPEYKVIFLRQLFGSIGKMTLFTEGFRNRFEKMKELEKQIKPIRIPFLFRIFIFFIATTKNEFLYKFYVFYILRYFIK